jgi:hypothetical protein
MYNVAVGLYDTSLVFSEIKPKTQTKWADISSSYSSGYIKFIDHKQREYTFRPIDYVGEKLYEKGFMTFIIEYIDTTTRKGHGSFSFQE